MFFSSIRPWLLGQPLLILLRGPDRGRRDVRLIEHTYRDAAIRTIALLLDEDKRVVIGVIELLSRGHCCGILGRRPGRGRFGVVRVWNRIRVRALRARLQLFPVLFPVLLDLGSTSPGLSSAGVRRTVLMA